MPYDVGSTLRVSVFLPSAEDKRRLALWCVRMCWIQSIYFQMLVLTYRYDRTCSYEQGFDWEISVQEVLYCSCFMFYFPCFTDHYFITEEINLWLSEWVAIKHICGHGQTPSKSLNRYLHVWSCIVQNTWNSCKLDC